MCEREEPFNRPLHNNNRVEGVLADGDANANAIQQEDDGRTGDTSSVLQDKVMGWGPDSQCDDPELAEFEMLECQELETYLVEDGEDYVGLKDRKDVEVELKAESQAAKKWTVQGAVEQEYSTEESRTEMHSEADVFISCVSTISTMDNVGDASVRAQWADSKTEGRARDELSHSCQKSTIQQKAVDMNSNSATQAANANSQLHTNNSAVQRSNVSDDYRENNNQINAAGGAVLGFNEHKDATAARNTHEDTGAKKNKSTQADETTAGHGSPHKTSTRGTQSSPDSRAIRKQGSFDNTLKKQNSFDRSFKKQPSFDNIATGLERRRPWGSPSRPSTPTSPKTTSSSPVRRPPGSPARAQGPRALSSERSGSPQRSFSGTSKLPAKASSSSGIPKPVAPQQKESEPMKSSPPQKAKNIRPKIITYVRKTPQTRPQGTDASLEVASLPGSSYPSPKAQKDQKAGFQVKSTAAPCSSNFLFDKHRQEMQKTDNHPSGTVATGMKALSGSVPQRLGRKSGSFHEDIPMKCPQEPVPQEGGGGYCSARTLRPQLGLGAVTRQPAAKTRVQQAGHRSTTGPSQNCQDPTGELKRSGGREVTPKSLLLKPGQTGLRPPGFSTLPAAHLATFGFVRSSSVSSVSNDRGHADARGHAQHPGSDADDSLRHKLPTRPSEAPHTENSPAPPDTPGLKRRSLPPQRCSPLVSRRDFQKDKEAVIPKSSPPRFAVVSPKPQSPVRGRAAEVHRAGLTQRAPELDPALIQQLRDRCDEQARQLQSLQAQFNRTSLCLDVFSITTQHFCHKSERAIVKERELSLELARIRDEVAFSVAHWEQLQQEKQELECRFKADLQGLRAQQRRELGALEERLKAQHMAETESLHGQHQSELEELQFQQQEQIEEIRESHEASLMEMETTHSDTVATLQEEHARTVKNLKMAHEQQTKSLEEEFEKIRLSLQDQVDTLTFQNRSLRDRAKRFEEALRRSTDEQIVEALAPYKHIEEDLKSLKEVLEMKNQQIHQQDLKISELEKIQAEKNVYLEERLQVLQQQNEDLKIRIDKNIAVSRQLSEENANLQVNVVKESNEKKRLSRTNEELLWRLQTGELSPRMSPSSSPIHRVSSVPGSPARPHSYHQ
ncbi:microtubule-associated tumor suppressor candidate 2 homolog isoform X1 [Takifugu rubripes]|uniref:microtubule-associated tumor suppressor candidate 2 homolog isoform X1 n=1 Tax=Takifugu rubripes TaxID=31033 RepID=UPI001145DAD6|nr:microtubule-associated tumor suppressor candidate 2 homolog isoform X1 [Takifugu rubripes]